MIGWENIELISDRPLETMLDEFKRLKNEYPDRYSSMQQGCHSTHLIRIPTYASQLTSSNSCDTTDWVQVEMYEPNQLNVLFARHHTGTPVTVKVVLHCECSAILAHHNLFMGHLQGPSSWPIPISSPSAIPLTAPEEGCQAGYKQSQAQGECGARHA